MSESLIINNQPGNPSLITVKFRLTLIFVFLDKQKKEDIWTTFKLNLSILTQQVNNLESEFAKQSFTIRRVQGHPFIWIRLIICACS